MGIIRRRCRDLTASLRLDLPSRDFSAVQSLLGSLDPAAVALGWANYLLTWTWLLWFRVGTVVGGIMLARDEWRLHRNRPKPEKVQAHADDLVARYGQEAFPINGDAMVAARSATEFDRYRFLEEVSGELVRRHFGPNLSDDPPSAGTQKYRERPANALSLVQVDPVLNDTKNTNAAPLRPCVTS